MDNEKNCGGCKGFDFCFWAKLLVAIPALSIIGIAAASQFSEPAVQIVVGGVAAFIAMFVAIKIDRMFPNKIRK